MKKAWYFDQTSRVKRAGPARHALLQLIAINCNELCKINSIQSILIYTVAGLQCAGEACRLDSIRGTTVALALAHSSSANPVVSAVALSGPEFTTHSTLSTAYENTCVGKWATTALERPDTKVKVRSISISHHMTHHFSYKFHKED